MRCSHLKRNLTLQHCHQQFSACSGMDTELFMLGQKKSSLVSGNWPGEILFYHSPARIAECVSEYILLISKNRQTWKKTRIQKK